MKNKKGSFSGSLGFVLAAAGSAVGVGNIWRFPYLCAKDGGGLFLVVYLVLVLTFGFVLLTTDVAIGRKTKQNALNAFGTLKKGWKFLDYQIFCPVSDLRGDTGGGGRILYKLHYLPCIADRVYAAVFGADGLGGLLRCGKGN